jgi:SRSO17 transposase
VRLVAHVQRQYTGTAGRIENAQVAVYLTYATDRTRSSTGAISAKSCTDDPDRSTDAGIPTNAALATKRALATSRTHGVHQGARRPQPTGQHQVVGVNPGPVETERIITMMKRATPSGSG